MRFVLGFCLALMTMSAWAKDTTPYHFDDAFVRATPAKVSAGYAIIHNATDKKDALVSATADWAARIELHSIVTNDAGVMQMKQIDSIPVPAHGEAILRPGGYHLMIFGVKEPLKENDTRSITLTFVSGIHTNVTFDVKPMTYGGKKSGHMSHHQH